MITLDAVFIINQDTQPSTLKTLCENGGFQEVLIITTHYLFKNERSKLRNLLPIRTATKTFSDFLSDQELQQCDDEATQKLLPTLNDEDAKHHYNATFIEQSLFNKNGALFAKINEQYSVNIIFYQNGLGISGRFWDAVGAKSLLSDKADKPGGFLRSKIARIKERFRALIITEILFNQTLFCFPTSVGRLKFAPDADIISYTVQPYRLLYARLFKGPNFHLKYALRKAKNRKRRVVIATTIHGYSSQLEMLRFPIEIFIDGYHPSNYPRSYIDSFLTGTFIVRDMFDAKWFTRFNKPAKKPYSFTQKEELRTAIESSKELRRVYLVLNHGGDWTALINRSDTDILIEKFSFLSQYFPELTFIIRTHPTAVHPSHEGVRSLSRIQSYVDSFGNPNLHLSKSSLLEDLSRGDIFVSEYSNVLLDVYKIGKLGIIANFTGRRSFMKDYEDLGFLHVETETGMIDLFKNICKNKAPYVERQISAAMKYNLLLEELYQERETSFSREERGDG